MPPMKGSSSSWLDDDGDGADGAAQGERAHVAHEDFSRMRVVPEEADGGADHGSAEDGQFADERHALQFEVVGEDDVAADVGEHGERAGGDDGAADGEAVQAVGQVDGVAWSPSDTSMTKMTNGRKARKPQMRDVAAANATRGRGEGLDERHAQLRGIHA